MHDLEKDEISAPVLDWLAGSEQQVWPYPVMYLEELEVLYLVLVLRGKLVY